MKPMTEQEWSRVQECLVRGGLRECIDDLLSTRVYVTPRNMRIIQQAYDAGDGLEVELVHGEGDWFIGMYDDFEVFHAIERDGVLYTLAHASGGGLVTVLVGDALVRNEVGITLPGMSEAKAYVEGLVA